MTAKRKKKIRVLEVGQWISTGDIGKFTLKSFDIEKISGGDSKAAKDLGIAGAEIIEVEEDWRPLKGKVWYRPGPGGRLKLWKANYDSSG